MQGQKGTPAGQSCLIQFQNQLLHVQQPAPGRITINFDQISKNLKHQILNYELQKINFKTVIGSLKGQHPNILSATLQKNHDQLFVLTIKVSYQFLPQTIQTLLFDKREISAQQSDQIAVKNMKNYLQNIKQQISSLTNMNAISGQIDTNCNPFQIFVKIPHPKTIYTLGLNFQKAKNTLCRVQMYYFNSATKDKKNTKIMPDQGIFIHHNNDAAYTEMRFFAEQDTNGYDYVMFELKDNWKGTYLVSIEKVVAAGN